jgi:glucokinase
MAVLALDIGGTKIAAAAFTETGGKLLGDTVPLGGRAGAEVGALAVDMLQRTREHVRAAGHEVDAVGAIIPGIWHAARGRAWAPNIPGWDDYPLLEQLQLAAGQDVPVRVDSDRAGYILGETWLGAARGCRDAVCIAIGTGIGAGIMVDGRVLRGARDIAGAVGWMALDRPHLPGYASVGCFEHHASGPGIVKVARDRLAASGAASAAGAASALRDREADLTTADVFEAAAAGDVIAAGVIDEAVEFWGMAAANFVSVFDPEVVVFAGGVFGPAARYIDRIREVALRWAQPISMPQVPVTVSGLGGDAGLLGAGHLALRALQSDPTATG